MCDLFVSERPAGSPHRQAPGGSHGRPCRAEPGRRRRAEPPAFLGTAVLFVRAARSGGSQGLPVGPRAGCSAAGITPFAVSRNV